MAQGTTSGNSTGHRVDRMTGFTTKVGTPVVEVLEVDANRDVLLARGANVPTDADAGYAKGCKFIKTDGGVATTVYLNEGSATSADFNAVESSASTVTGVTAGDGLSGGGTEGTVTLDSILQFQDEGVDLGAPGTAEDVNFVGAGVTATRVGDVVTVTVPGSGGDGSGSAHAVEDASGFAMLAGTTLTLTSFSAPSIIATGNIGETTLAGAAPIFGSGSDLGTTAPYATAVTDADALHTSLLALTGTEITTPSTLETNNLSGLGAGVFAPGVYTTASAINMSASQSITLSGAGDYVFVSTGGAITFGATDTMVLTNGATAARVFWVADAAITTGATNTLFGNFLSGDASTITIGSTNTIEGRLLSKAAITIDGTSSTFSLPTSLPADSVGTSQLQFGSVTGDQLAADSVDGTKIEDDAVSLEHLDAGITPSHIVIAAGKFTTVGGDTVETIPATGAVGTDLAFVSVQSGNSGPVVTAVPGTDDITVVLTADPGNDDVLTWQVLRAAS